MGNKLSDVDSNNTYNTSANDLGLFIIHATNEDGAFLETAGNHQMC